MDVFRGTIYSEDFEVSVAIVLTSASPRWRMARALEAERSEGRGGIVHGLKSFSEETQSLCQ